MTRTQTLLTVVGAVLLLVLFWLLLWSPKTAEIDELQAETETIQGQQQQTTSRIVALEAVRDEAPEQEALLAAAQSLVPRDAGLPSFLRQVQRAADEAGLDLLIVSPARPTPVEAEGAPDGLHRIGVSMELEGGYFQVVDFLRRIEDPAISPRGTVFNTVVVSGDPEEHPSLTISLQGEVYAILATTPAEGPDTGEEEAETDAEAEADADVDAEVDEEDVA